MKTNNFMPDMMTVSVLDIPLQDLAKRNVKGMILDLDNTITEWNNPEIKDEMMHWFANLQQLGISACLLSNNKGPRVMEAAQKLGISYVSRATKPRRSGYRRAMEVLKTTEAETVVVGDQIFTDILGGNRTGLYTILVNPIGAKEFAGTKVNRCIERIFLKVAGIKRPK
ncbi:YqeG family HAD IIIA-type phosphatase [Dehalobacterium formicoaceticum]|uniref:YqeG family HAD IIIA-type phosphatase n=1 Tax=Dehalobacterium formicoaceticum TaxID=51515 RepID=A0ABT1Y7A1_9FIRM|nr:YqeG family HAD IIIA-type phosphatase [Dehalobacterium formicoaceticum]MCR6546763.1 YqeG family HAD IIIA-type phosphatase [Dehalobacterium formicoaceticum]